MQLQNEGHCITFIDLLAKALTESLDLSLKLCVRFEWCLDECRASDGLMIYYPIQIRPEGFTNPKLKMAFLPQKIPAVNVVKMCNTGNRS